MRSWRHAGSTAWLVAALAFFVLPLLLAVVASFSTEPRLQGAAFRWPDSLTTEHYRALLAERGFWVPLRNSVIVAGSTTLICVALAAPCAWAIVRLRFPGRRLLLLLFLAVGMFPQVAILSPLFLLLRGLGLVDTLPGLVLPYLTFGMPLAVWLLAAFFRSLPEEIEQAARVDGAGSIRLLVEIVLPLAAPALAATAILTFIYCWNEFLFALAFTISPERHTVPVAVALFRGRYQVPWGEILAAATLASLPVAALVFAFQRRIVQGLTAGAIKG